MSAPTQAQLAAAAWVLDDHNNINRDPDIDAVVIWLMEKAGTVRESSPS